MIQDASPVRSGLPDGYLAHFKVDYLTAGTTYTLDTRRLPSGFSVTRASQGLLNVTFPTCFAVRWIGGGVDPKVTTDAAQCNVGPININPNAGTMQVIIQPAIATPVANDPANLSEVHFTFAMEAL